MNVSKVTMKTQERYYPIIFSEAVARECSLKYVFVKLWQNLEETPVSDSFLKEETPMQVFFCKFCEIFKNTFFTEHLR